MSETSLNNSALPVILANTPPAHALSQSGEHPEAAQSLSRNDGSTTTGTGTTVYLHKSNSVKNSPSALFSSALPLEEIFDTVSNRSFLVCMLANTSAAQAGSAQSLVHIDNSQSQPTTSGGAISLVSAFGSPLPAHAAF